MGEARRIDPPAQARRGGRRLSRRGARDRLLCAARPPAEAPWPRRALWGAWFTLTTLFSPLWLVGGLSLSASLAIIAGVTVSRAAEAELEARAAAGRLETAFAAIGHGDLSPSELWRQAFEAALIGEGGRPDFLRAEGYAAALPDIVGFERLNTLSPARGPVAFAGGHNNADLSQRVEAALSEAAADGIDPPALVFAPQPLQRRFESVRVIHRRSADGVERFLTGEMEGWLHAEALARGAGAAPIPDEARGALIEACARLADCAPPVPFEPRGETLYAVYLYGLAQDAPAPARTLAAVERLGGLPPALATPFLEASDFTAFESAIAPLFAQGGLNWRDLAPIKTDLQTAADASGMSNRQAAEIFSAVDGMVETLGAAGAARLLRHAQSPRDVERLQHLAQTVGEKAFALEAHHGAAIREIAPTGGPAPDWRKTARIGLGTGAGAIIALIFASIFVPGGGRVKRLDVVNAQMRVWLLGKND